MNYSNWKCMHNEEISCYIVNSYEIEKYAFILMYEKYDSNLSF